MRRLTLWLILMAIVVGCNSPTLPPTPAATETNRFFTETGQSVQNEFLDFFARYGGVDSLGYPISPEMVDGGWRVQYFEYGRLEFHPENDPAYRVTVGWLGDLLNRRQPSIPASSLPPGTASDRRYFPRTGHTLSGDFLRYFEANGDSVRFGQPISEPYLLEGQLAQDFQSARFFWTPTQSSPVMLEDIGRVHLNRLSGQ